MDAEDYAYADGVYSRLRAQRPARAPQRRQEPDYERAHPWEDEPWTEADEAALEDYEDRRRQRLAEAQEY